MITIAAVGAFDSTKGTHFRISDVRRVRTANGLISGMEPQFPLRMEATGLVDEVAEKWARGLAGAKTRTTYGEARALIDYGKRLQCMVRDAADGKTSNPPTLPLVSYYGTGRLWNEMRLTSSKKSDKMSSRTDGYMNCLDSSSRYRIFEDWFERLCRIEFEERESPQKLVEVQSLLTAIRSSVDTVLAPSRWGEITFKSSETSIVATHPTPNFAP